MAKRTKKVYVYLLALPDAVFNDYTKGQRVYLVFHDRTEAIIFAAQEGLHPNWKVIPATLVWTPPKASDD